MLGLILVGCVALTVVMVLVPCVLATLMLETCEARAGTQTATRSARQDGSADEARGPVSATPTRRSAYLATTLASAA